MSGPRRITAFSSVDGQQTVTFPALNYEWAPQQALASAMARVVGGDYAVDLLGTRPAAKEPGKESVTFGLAYDSPAALEAAWDSLNAALTTIGRGKLWSTGAAGDKRWAWARASGLADARFSADTQLLLPVSVTFDRLSDWFAEAETVIIEPVTASPHSFTITVNGNAPVRNAVFRFRSNGATTGNLITNGQFETDSSGWSAYNGATKTKETFDAHSGSGSMQVVTPGAVAGEGAISDIIPAVAGATYEYRLWVKQGSGTGGQIKAEAWAHDGGGFLANLQGSDPVTLDGTWQEIVGTVTAPAGTTNLTLTIYTDGFTEALTWWVDDVSLKRVGGFTTPQLTNLTTGESFSSTRIAAGADDELRVDCGRWAVEYSTTNGATYTNDYANFSYGGLQVAMMNLVPGANSIQVVDSGTPNYELEISWFDTFH